MDITTLQKGHPDAGGFRLWSLLARPEISVRTVERIMALNRQVYDGLTERKLRQHPIWASRAAKLAKSGS